MSILSRKDLFKKRTENIPLPGGFPEDPVIILRGEKLILLGESNYSDLRESDHPDEIKQYTFTDESSNLYEILINLETKMLLCSRTRFK